jgi:hypothetical protein
LFLIGRMQGLFDGLQDGIHAQAVGVSVAISGACLEIPIAAARLEEVVGASAQKKLKHGFMSGRKPRSSSVV